VVIMNTRKHKVELWVLLVFGVLVLAAWFYFSEVSLYGGKQVVLIEEFLRTNLVVRSAVGKCQAVRLDRRRASVSGYGDDLSGTYYFIMQSEAGEEKQIRVDWQYKNDALLVEQVYSVTGWEQKVIFDRLPTN